MRTLHGTTAKAIYKRGKPADEVGPELYQTALKEALFLIAMKRAIRERRQGGLAASHSLPYNRMDATNIEKTAVPCKDQDGAQWISC